MYVVQQTTKKCFICKEYLSLDKFSKDKSKSDGLTHKCRQCRSFTRIRSDKEKENNKKYISILKTTDPLKAWILTVLRSSKNRAKNKNLQHDLDKTWLLDNLPEYCPVLGIKLSFEGNRNNSPSIDRFNNDLGYTKDNCRIISCRANILKNNATIEELDAIIKYMKGD